MSLAITNELLNRLSDELAALSSEALERAKSSIEDDDIKLDRELALMLHDLSVDRGLLCRFAYLVRNSASQNDALKALAA